MTFIFLNIEKFDILINEVFMKIIIDADASPVRSITTQLAREYKIELVIVSNVHHMIESDYGEVIRVDSGNDVADHEIVKICQKGDLVVTQDYGLASLILLKGAYAIHHNGWFYTQDNIDMLLLQRQIGQKMRKAKKRYGHIPKRKASDDDLFKEKLEDFIREHIQKKG